MDRKNDISDNILEISQKRNQSDREMERSQKKEKEEKKVLELIRERLCEETFRRQENLEIHNPYDQEQRELESIENGDEDALRQSILESYKGEIGRLAKDPLRHHKNVAIGNVTLASRAAIRGGVTVEQSFTMADSFIQHIEELDTISDVIAFKTEMKCLYAKAVREGKTRGKTDKRNPLVARAKDYIFQHLHDAIQVCDMAKEFGVNPDYLSHLFRREENMTIKRYILNEKIYRSKNLLKYSDYGIREIGFYLGFSSQSHFTKTFREIVGMNPQEYRREFGNRDGWKIKK